MFILLTFQINEIRRLKYNMFRCRLAPTQQTEGYNLEPSVLGDYPHREYKGGKSALSSHKQKASNLL